MKRIYVRFAGDNDFINTVRPFVMALAERVLDDRYGDWSNITKAQVVELFNEHAYSYYIMNQCQEPSYKDQDKHRNYLKIREKDVYFDSDIDGIDLSQCNHDGCMAYVGPDGEVVGVIM